MTNAKILIVQDDRRGAPELQERLEGLGYTVCAAASGRQAAEKAAETLPDLALIDLGLEGNGEGVEAAERLGRRFDVPVVYLADGAGEDLLQRAEATRPFGYVLQPFEERQLRLNVETALSMKERLRRHEETEAELRRTADDLQEQARLMETVFDSISDGVVAVDENGVPILRNLSASRITGIHETQTRLEDRPKVYGFFLPDKETPFPPGELPLVRAVRGEATDEVELFIRNPGVPEGVFISVNGRPLLDDAGVVKGGVVVLRDVTGLKQAETELKRTADEFQAQTRIMETVFDSMSDGLAIVDERGTSLVLNSSARRMTGIDEREIKAEERSATHGLFLPDGETLFPADELPLARAIRGEESDGVEIFIRNPNVPLEGVTISVSGRPLRDDEGRVIGGVSVFHDVTGLKLAEAELQRTADEFQAQTRLMETVFDSIGDGLAIVDENGTSLVLNPSARHITGIHEEETRIEDRPEKYGLFLPDKKTPFPVDELTLVRAMRGEATDNVEIFIRNPNVPPEGVTINISGRPLRDDEGRVIGGVSVFRDVTELKRNADALQAQARLMETVFTNMSDGLTVVDENGDTLVRNPSARRITGVAKREVKSEERSVEYGFFLPDQKTPFPVDELPLARAVRGEASDGVEIFIRNPNVPPEGVTISVNGRPIRDDAGVLRGGAVVYRDVTELKKAESELRQTADDLQAQTHLMETIFDSMSDGVAVSDESGELTLFNPGARRMTGIDEPEMSIEKRAAQYGIFLPGGETPFPVDELPLSRVMRGEEVDEVELFIRNPNVPPEGVTISVNGRPIRDDAGVVRGGVNVLRDVTRLKRTEAELKRTADDLQAQSHLMETVFNSMSDGVTVVDENGKFLFINPSTERIIGMSTTALERGLEPEQWAAELGIFFPDRVTPVPSAELPLIRAIRGEESDEVELFIRNSKTPQGVYISVSGRQLRDDTGAVKGGVSVFRDVTERMRAEEALAQAFSHGRLEVVDTILHNIGNAINSVTIGVGTIQEKLEKNELLQRFSALAKAIEAHRENWIPYLQTDPQGQKVMPFILALAEDLTRQNAELKGTFDRVQDRVGHIVDIIRMQRAIDHGTMASKDINLRKAIADAVRLLESSITNRNIRIRIDCQNAPEEIRIEESRFHQMLVNLIKNAIEAIDELAKSRGTRMKQPFIFIRAYVKKDFLVIDVIDNGIGIDQQRSKVIFTAGYTTKETGSGLGLHSAANFVIGSGGQIKASSDGVGKGSTMRIKLRLSSVTPKHEHVTARRGGGGGDLVNSSPGATETGRAANRRAAVDEPSDAR